MDNQILAKLKEAEDTLASLKALLGSQDGSDAPPGPEEKRRRYMTLSTTRLFETRGKEEFRIADSVGLYFIVPNTRVRTAARSAVLRIVSISEYDHQADYPPAFIQVGEWVYPLMEGSMVYRSENNYYLFPDLLATVPGSSVGVVLPKSMTLERRKEFERIILKLVGLKAFPPQPPQSFGKSTDLIMNAKTSVSLVRSKSGGVYAQRSSQILRAQGQGRSTSQPQGYGKQIGEGFKAGGRVFSRGLELGAHGTANLMTLYTSCLKSALPEAENNVEIPRVIAQGAMYAKDVTGRVLELSSSILGGLAQITSQFATLTACYIKSSAAPYFDAAIESSGMSRGTVDEITSELKDIGEGIMSGSSDIYAGMESAAQILASSLNHNAVDVIAHCYGDTAADVLHTAGEVVGNVALAGMNAGQVISPRNLGGRVAQEAGESLALGQCGS